MNSVKQVKITSKILIVGFVLTLMACSCSEFGDLPQYVKEVKSRPGAKIAGLPAAKSYARLQYQYVDLWDPSKPTVKVSADVGPTGTN